MAPRRNTKIPSSSIPKNPAAWNQLANYYGEYGGLTNAFAYYTEAIRLDPTEPVYYQNFATTVYLFRKDAREFYHINEQQVFDKALGLYRQAMKLDPSNLVLATDYAESYYGIKPHAHQRRARRMDELPECLQRRKRAAKAFWSTWRAPKSPPACLTKPRAISTPSPTGRLRDVKQRLVKMMDRYRNPTNDEPESVTNPISPALKPVAPAPAPAPLTPVSTNVLNLSSNLFVAPPVLREQK